MADLPKMWDKMSMTLKKRWWAANGGGKPFPAEEGGRSAAAAKRSPVKKGVATSELSRGEKTSSGKMSDVRRENMRRMKTAMEKGTAGAPQKTTGAGGSGMYSPSTVGDIKRAIKGGVGVRTGLGGHSDYDKVMPEREKKKMKEEKDLTGALRKSIESKGKHTVARNKAGTLVLRKMKKEEVEQMNEVKVGQRGRLVHDAKTKTGSGYSGEVVAVKDGQVHMKIGSGKFGDRIVKGSMSRFRAEEVEQVQEAHKVGDKVMIPKKVSDEEKDMIGTVHKVHGSEVTVKLPDNRGNITVFHHEVKKVNKEPTDADIEIQQKRDERRRDLGYMALSRGRGPLKREEVEYIEEKLTAADPASTWISDFVKSDNPKFEGKSKKERMNMALGAYYAAKRSKNEEVVQEKLDPVGKETTDIDNDKDVDKTDRYLHARRQAIGKAIAKKRGM